MCVIKSAALSLRQIAQEQTRGICLCKKVNPFLSFFLKQINHAGGLFGMSLEKGFSCLTKTISGGFHSAAVYLAKY